MTKLIEERIHTKDGRFYWRDTIQEYYPSITTVIDVYPKGPGLDRWKAEQGYEGAKLALKQAGIQGTNVHDGVELLDAGETLCYDHYTETEWKCLMSFVQFWKDYNCRTIDKEVRVFSDTHKVAGTYDWFGLCDVPRGTKDVHVLIDWKSSRNLWPSYDVQLATYEKLRREMGMTGAERLMIVQLGASTKKGYSVHTVKDNGDLFSISFLSCLALWRSTHPTAKPYTKEFPRYLSLVREDGLISL